MPSLARTVWCCPCECYYSEDSESAETTRAGYYGFSVAFRYTFFVKSHNIHILWMLCDLTKKLYLLYVASSTSLDRRVGPAILPSRATCTTSATSSQLAEASPFRNPDVEVVLLRMVQSSFKKRLGKVSFLTVTLPPFQVVRNTPVSKEISK